MKTKNILIIFIVFLLNISIAFADEVSVPSQINPPGGIAVLSTGSITVNHPQYGTTALTYTTYNRPDGKIVTIVNTPFGSHDVVSDPQNAGQELFNDLEQWTAITLGYAYEQSWDYTPEEHLTSDIRNQILGVAQNVITTAAGTVPALADTTITIPTPAAPPAAPTAASAAAPAAKPTAAVPTAPEVPEGAQASLPDSVDPSKKQYFKTITEDGKDVLKVWDGKNWVTSKSTLQAAESVAGVKASPVTAAPAAAPAAKPTAAPAEKPAESDAELLARRLREIGGAKPGKKEEKEEEEKEEEKKPKEPIEILNAAMGVLRDPKATPAQIREAAETVRTRASQIILDPKQSERHKYAFELISQDISQNPQFYSLGDLQNFQSAIKGMEPEIRPPENIQNIINNEIKKRKEGISRVRSTMWRRITNPVKIVGYYKDFKALAGLFGDDEEIQERVIEIRKKICGKIPIFAGEACWKSKLCEKHVDTVGSDPGMLVTVTPTGKIIPVIHVEGWRTPKAVFINETTGEITSSFSRLYKITYLVVNPSEERGNGYNLLLKSSGNIKYRRFLDNQGNPKFKFLNASESDGMSGSFPLMFYSTKEYDEVCIVMKESIEVSRSIADVTSTKEVCNTLAEHTGAPTTIEGELGGAGAGSDDQVNVNQNI